MKVDQAVKRTESEDSAEARRSRVLLMTKATGLLLVLAIVGAALLIVLWLLVTIVVSLLASL